MSELKVNKISPRSGTDVTLGDSGDTFTLGSGANIAGLTLSDNILFDTASKGIYLGTTSATASNLLDDYEEGTFTPEFADATSGGNTATFTSVDGRYVKIGKQVTLDITFANINTSGLTSGNAIIIRNLPFVIENTGFSTVGSVLIDRFTFSGYVISQSASNASYLVLKDNINNTVDSQLLVSSVAVSGGSDIAITHIHTTA